MLHGAGDWGQHERRVAADEEGGSAVGTFIPLLERREEGTVQHGTVQAPFALKEHGGV